MPTPTVYPRSSECLLGAGIRAEDITCHEGILSVKDGLDDSDGFGLVFHFAVNSVE